MGRGRPPKNKVHEKLYEQINNDSAYDSISDITDEKQLQQMGIPIMRSKDKLKNRSLFMLMEKDGVKTWSTILEKDLYAKIKEGMMEENTLIIYPRHVKAVKNRPVMVNL